MPLFAVVVNAVVPELAKADAVLIVLSLLTDRLVNVSPPEARLTAPVFTTVALPVVLSVRLGVAVLIEPMLPELCSSILMLNQLLCLSQLLSLYPVPSV